MKDVIVKALGIDEYKAEAERFKKKYETVKELLEHEKVVSKEMTADYLELVEENNKLKADPKKWLQDELEFMQAVVDEDALNAAFNRGVSRGRQDAYFDMGIRNIEAHERGNVLCRMPDGEILEVILGLEDVEPEETGMISDDEITIDDLMEV